MLPLCLCELSMGSLGLSEVSGMHVLVRRRERRTTCSVKWSLVSLFTKVYQLIEEYRSTNTLHLNTNFSVRRLHFDF